MSSNPRTRVIEMAESLGWEGPGESDSNNYLIRLRHKDFLSPVYVVKNDGLSIQSFKFVVDPDHYREDLVNPERGVERALVSGKNKHLHSGFLGFPNDPGKSPHGLGYKLRDETAVEWLLHELASGGQPMTKLSESPKIAPEAPESSNFGLPYLNTILYGPPGTGKTWRTFREAVKICDTEASDDHVELRKRYLELVKDKRIEFVSFHQSFSYEDFVEGIRPDLTSKKIKGSDSDETAKDSGANGKVEDSNADEKVEDNNAGIKYELRRGIFRQICARARKAEAENYVLIIDEINRANISRVMGDLITLLEEDKRAGKENEIEVTLPYSGEQFTVPSNLYIVGTMNTADRSIALMDTALRRRFEFVEVPPKSALLNDVKVDDIDIKHVMEAINERIELLYDRDHLIGHTYFLPLKDEPTLRRLERIFKQHIIPLLEEYFFEDWDKIRRVLGDHDKPEALQFVRRIEARMACKERFGPRGADVPHGLARDVYRKEDPAFKDTRAYIAIYTPSGSASTPKANAG